MPPLHVFYAVMTSALWGVNYVAARIGIEAFPPFLYNGLRFVTVALLLLPFVKAPPRAQLKQIAWIALVLCVGHMGLIFVAIDQGLNIAGSSLVMQMGVPFSCLLAAIYFKDRIGAWRMAGLALSLLGVLLMAGDPNVLEYPHAYVIALISAFMWAVSNIQIKKLGDVGVFQLLAWEAAFAAPMLVGLSFILERQLWPAAMPSFPALASLAYTALLSTITAFGLWSWLIRRHEVSLVAPYSLLIPLFAMGSGQLFFAETLSAALIVGGILTTLGVGIITIRRPKLQEMAERI
jgi:O-acetylserine/cysteine efflux transporter